jgi:CelD/BcsL family acetyltransferase involved in cellulose biosynthesis
MTPISTAPLQLTCSVVTDVGELESLRAEWLDLLGRSDSNEPMLSPAWLLNWWHVFGPADGRRLRTLLFRNGGRLVGVAPLLWRRHWYKPGLPFRRVEFLGSGEREEDGVGSDYLNVIAEGGAEEPVARGLVDALVSGRLGAWDEVVLPVMNGEGRMPRLLVDGFARRGLRASLDVTDQAPYVPLPPSWDGYLKQLGQRNRYLVTRSLRDFEAWAAGAAVFHRAETPEQLEEGKRLLTRLHRERWSADGAPGTFRTPRNLAFHDRVTAELLADGALELVWITVRGEAVAAQYNLLWNGKVYYYQCGRKMDVPPKVRPGVVLLARQIRVAIEAGAREFDFLGGASRYKMQLAAALRPLVRLRVARPGVLERARRLADWGIARTRTLRKRCRRWFRRANPSPSPQAPAETDG